MQGKCIHDFLKRSFVELPLFFIDYISLERFLILRDESFCFHLDLVLHKCIQVQFYNYNVIIEMREQIERVQWRIVYWVQKLAKTNNG